VAGKTGTAQKFDRQEGRYASNRFNAWFIGVAPADRPRVAIVAGLDEPKRPLHTGGAAAAPLFARVAAAQLSRMGISTEPAVQTAGTKLAAIPAAVPSEPAQAPAAPPPAPDPLPAVAAEPDRFVRLDDRILLPDFRGLSRKEVTEITAKSGLDVDLLGWGRVIAQDPPPGTVVAVREGRVKIRFAAPEDRR
jgi:membrane peptidoglycan carboxypeptidase